MSKENCIILLAKFFKNEPRNDLLSLLASHMFHTRLHSILSCSYISNTRTAIPICLMKLILSSYIIPSPMGYRIAFSLVLASAFHSYPLELERCFSKILLDYFYNLEEIC